MDIPKTIEKVSAYCDYKFGETNTKHAYCYALKIFLNEFYNLELKAISDDSILQYLLKINGRSNRCNHHSAIKLMYRVHGFKNKMRFIPYPEKEDKLPIHVNTEEFIKLISVCENEKHILALAYLKINNYFCYAISLMKTFKINPSFNCQFVHSVLVG